MLIRLDGLLRALVVLLALTAFGLYAFVVINRINYPFELEWMEGATVDTVSRVLDGQPIYTEPSTAWVSPLYGPLSYYVGAGFARLFGIGFFAQRLMSVTASIGCFVMLYLWARRETHFGLASLVAPGVFAATFAVSGAWFDLARVDMVFVILLLCALYSLRFAERERDLAVSGVLLGLSFLAKQNTLIVALPLVIYVLLAHKRRSWAFIGGLALVGGGTSLLFDVTSNGWFRYFVLGMGEQDDYILGPILTFWSEDLQSVMIAFAAAIGYVIWLIANHRREAGFYLTAGIGILATCYLARLHGGGFINGLIPLHAFLALGAALALAQIARTFGNGRPIGAPLAVAGFAAISLQFITLIYLPQQFVPTAEDRAAGEQFIDLLRQQPDEVLVFAHGYYAEMAGKTGGHVGWLMALYGNVGEEASAAKRAFAADIQAQLADQRWGALIIDQAIFVSEAYTDAIERYYVGEPIIFPDDDAFRPVTGLETRPLALYTRRNLSAAASTNSP
ncbi:MAG: glycosyltransferase family 39 protein [Anaerolineae bacterium]|nr:glycosyltransferase family 39 protein [Anaerolineae bacterium]